MSLPSYAIKRPAATPGPGKRRTFAIQEVLGPKRKTLELEAVDAINRAFLAGEITPREAARQVESVRDGLYKQRPEARLVFSSENLKLVDRYWKTEYEGRDLLDPDTMLADLKRAAAACGTTSIMAASRRDLQDAVDLALRDSPTKQRRVVSRLNQLLRYSGRDFKLRKLRAERPEPQYLTWAELEQVLPHLPTDHWRLLARVAWVTGCRLGEIFGLTPTSLRIGHVLVNSQLDEDMRRRATKTRSERKVPVLRGNQGEIWVSGWVSLEDALKAEMRTIRHSTVFKRACRRAFKAQKTKHCRFHDLRHSYAIELLGRSVPIGLVAKSLGNSVLVCERHYSGFSLQDENVDMVMHLLSRG